MPLIQPQREILTTLMPLRDYLHQEYQARLDRIILFGSQARGDGELKSLSVKPLRSRMTPLILSFLHGLYSI